ncbi:MAG: YggT family protein [Armatimonadota bacterium]|nr:YggT family protein [Armatimonadota bacterium]
MADAVQLVNLAYQVLNVLILIRIVLSWVPGLAGDHPVVRVVHQLTSPILEPIRRLMPPVGGLDLSPLVAILLLYLVRDLLVSILWSL